MHTILRIALRLRGERQWGHRGEEYTSETRQGRQNTWPRNFMLFRLAVMETSE